MRVPRSSRLGRSAGKHSWIVACIVNAAAPVYEETARRNPSLGNRNQKKRTCNSHQQRKEGNNRARKQLPIMLQKGSMVPSNQLTEHLGVLVLVPSVKDEPEMPVVPSKRIYCDACTSQSV